MAWRFKKSLSLGGGLRLNIGKKGLGLSAGVKGLRFGVGSRGAYSSVGIPGTGLYSVSYMKGTKAAKGQIQNGNVVSLARCFMVALFLMGIFLLVAGQVSGLIPIFSGGIIYYFWRNRPKQQIQRKLAEIKTLLDSQNYEEAIRLAREARGLDKDNDDLLLLLGSLLKDAGKYDEGIEVLKDYVARNTDDFDAQLILANCYYNAKRFHDAIGLLQKFPEERENDIRVIQLLGTCFATEKKYELAVNVFKKAPLQKRNLDADLMGVHYSLGSIYEKMGDKKNALKHFGKVYAVDIGFREVAEKMRTLERAAPASGTPT